MFLSSLPLLDIYTYFDNNNQCYFQNCYFPLKTPWTVTPTLWYSKIISLEKCRVKDKTPFLYCCCQSVLLMRLKKQQQYEGASCRSNHWLKKLLVPKTFLLCQPRLFTFANSPLHFSGSPAEGRHSAVWPGGGAGGLQRPGGTTGSLRCRPGPIREPPAVAWRPAAQPGSGQEVGSPAGAAALWMKAVEWRDAWAGCPTQPGLSAPSHPKHPCEEQQQHKKQLSYLLICYLNKFCWFVFFIIHPMTDWTLT